MAIKRITTNLIKDSDIATVDIANNAITAAKITDGNITTAKLADLSVTAGKLAGTLDLTGKTITVATATTGDNDTSPASTAFVQQEIAALVDSSPSSLNTLNELAAALGDDASFSTTVTNSIATKLPLAGGPYLPLAGGTMTGDLKMVNSSGATLDINSNASAADSKILLHEGTSASPANGASIRYDGANNLFKIGVGSSVDTTRLTIDRDTGNVGIGTSSPDTLLHLNAVQAGSVIRLARQDGAVVANDSLGKIEFYTNDLTNTGVAGYIDVQAEGGAAGGSMIFGTGTAGSASEQVRIAASGNVGIGTDNPDDALVVRGNIASPHRIAISNENASGKEALKFSQGTTTKSWIEFDNSTSTFDVWQYTSNPLRFGTSNTERMRIDSSGNLIMTAGGTIRAGGANDLILDAGESGTPDIYLQSGGATKVKIEGSNGNVGIGTTNPQMELHVGSGTQSTAALAGIGIANGGSSYSFYSASDGTKQYIAGIDHNITYTKAGSLSNHSHAIVSNNTIRLFCKNDGFLGIGDVDPDSTVHIKNSTAGGPQIHMDDGTNSAFINFDGTSLQLSTQRDMVDGTWHNTSRSWGGINIVGHSTGSYITFVTAPSNNTSPSERLRIQANGGISFNGDTATANALDDYEEGTWTPACGATLATAVGKYTKIGNQVTVYYHFVTTGGLPSSTSQVIITGLPFTSNSGSLVAAPIYSRYYTPNDSSLTSLVQDSETQIRLMNINDQNFDYTIWGELEASGNNSVYIIGSATYMV